MIMYESEYSRGLELHELKEENLEGQWVKQQNKKEKILVL